jgi:hypothetical protein
MGAPQHHLKPAWPALMPSGRCIPFSCKRIPEKIIDFVMRRKRSAGDMKKSREDNFAVLTRVEG